MTTLVFQLYVIDLKMIQFVRNQKFQTISRIVTATKSEDFDTEKVKKIVYHFKGNLWHFKEHIWYHLVNISTYEIFNGNGPLVCSGLSVLLALIILNWTLYCFDSRRSSFSKLFGGPYNDNRTIVIKRHFWNGDSRTVRSSNRAS